MKASDGKMRMTDVADTEQAKTKQIKNAELIAKTFSTNAKSNQEPFE